MKTNILYQQIKKQKPHDHFNRQRKSIWQNLTHFHNKMLNKPGTEGNFLNIVKGIVNVIVKGERPFPLRSGTR